MGFTLYIFWLHVVLTTKNKSWVVSELVQSTLMKWCTPHAHSEAVFKIVCIFTPHKLFWDFKLEKQARSDLKTRGSGSKTSRDAHGVSSSHFVIYCRSGNNGGSKIQHIYNLALMQGFKYSRNAISEKLILLKQQTHLIMIDTNKSILGLFIPWPFLLVNTHTRGLMLTSPSRRYVYLKPIAIT